VAAELAAENGLEQTGDEGNIETIKTNPNTIARVPRSEGISARQSPDLNQEA